MVTGAADEPFLRAGRDAGLEVIPFQLIPGEHLPRQGPPHARTEPEQNVAAKIRDCR
jgi:hypothetical protein